MLDQSFSYNNFRIILDIENRRGKYLEDKNFFEGNDVFISSRTITDELIKLNKELKIEKKKQQSLGIKKEEHYLALLKNKEELIQERENKREKILQQISSNTNNQDFKINIQKGSEKHGKQLYITKNTPENYFVMKQLQRNIYKTFRVKQSNRKDIISQLKISLDDNFPKVIIRSDFKSFYETIPHKQLIARIEENSLLNYHSKNIIKDVLNQYWKILITDGVKSEADERSGIPRGLGISAYLSELYLSDFDKIVSALPNVTFYARYVDDIIIIFTPNNRAESKTSKNYRKSLNKIISKFKLEMNNEKTKVLDLRIKLSERKTNKKYIINYLGYKFIMSYKLNAGTEKAKIVREKNKVCMSDNKLERNRNKIIETFKVFEENILKFTGKEKQTNKLLIQRIKILTHNFQLYRRKNNVFVGIYFSNEYLTCLNDLETLDKVLRSEIKRVSPFLSEQTKKTLESFSFYKGFKNKKIITLNFNNNTKRGIFNIQRTLKIWDDL